MRTKCKLGCEDLKSPRCELIFVILVTGSRFEKLLVCTITARWSIQGEHSFLLCFCVLWVCLQQFLNSLCITFFTVVLPFHNICAKGFSVACTISVRGFHCPFWCVLMRFMRGDHDTNVFHWDKCRIFTSVCLWHTTTQILDQKLSRYCHHIIFIMVTFVLNIQPL